MLKEKLVQSEAVRKAGMTIALGLRTKTIDLAQVLDYIREPQRVILNELELGNEPDLSDLRQSLLRLAGLLQGLDELVNAYSANKETLVDTVTELIALTEPAPPEE